MNAVGGGLGDDIGDDRDEVDRLEVDVDVGFRRRGGGESGWMWIMLPRLSALLVLFKLAATPGRCRGEGESPPGGRLGSIPKVDSMPIEIADCGDGKDEWLRIIEKFDSRG